MSADRHVEAAEFVDLAAGRLGDARLAEIEAHLAECPTCSAAAVAVPEDPLTLDVRQAWGAYHDRPPADTTPMRLGTYRLLREVGRGGMGVVFEAVEESLGRHVALKMLPAHAQHDPRYLQRFQREARAAGRLLHRNIVPVYGVGVHDGVQYYVMQFIDGRSLDQLLREDGAPSSEQVARLGMQVAEALAYAHGQGVLHRDIKPSNLLLDAGGTVWVTDFGLAKASDGDDNLTGSSELVGTLRYLAPERFRGESDHRSDVYALGLTLYELLTLRPAFTASDRSQLIHQILHDPQPRPRAANPAVPQDLDTIVAKASAREPGHRYQTAADLADDLRRWLEDRPIRARPASRIEHTVRWCRRNPGVAGLLAVVGLTLLAGTSLVTWKWSDEARARGQAERAQVAAERSATLALAEKLRAEDNQHQTERLSAATTLDLAVSLADHGQVSRALLLLTRALEQAVRAGDADVERAARLNLAAWRGQFFRWRGRFECPNWVMTVAFSPDGRRFAFASRTGVVWVRDTANGELVAQPLRPGTMVTAIAFSPDGRRLLTGTDDEHGKGDAQLWDVSTGEKVGPLLVHDRAVAMLGFSADGLAMVVAGNEAQLWKPSPSGKGDATPKIKSRVPFSDRVTLPHPGGVVGAGFSPDGKVLATLGSDGTLRFWEPRTVKPLGNVIRLDTRRALPPGQVCQVTTVEFNPDSRLLLTGTLVQDIPKHDYPGGEARLWRVPSGEPFGAPLPSLGAVMTGAFSPDGRRVLTSHVVREPGPRRVNRGRAQLWDVATGRPVGAPLQASGPMWSVAFSPDSRVVLTGCEEGAGQFWLAANGQPLGQSFWSNGNARNLAIAPDGRTALVGHTFDDSVAELWDVPPGPGNALTSLQEQRIRALAFSPDGQWLLTGGDDTTARLWDLRGRQVRETARAGATDLSPHFGRFHGPPLRHRGSVASVAFSPDGRLALTGGEDMTAQMWDVATGQPHGPALQTQGPIVQVAFSPDGKLALSGGWDGTVRLWDAATGQPHGPPLQPHDAVLALAISPDGRLVLMGLRKGVRLFDLAAKKYRNLADDMSGWVGAVAFSPDGRLALAGSWDGTARLWDVATGQRRGPVLRHGGQVRVAAFSPDGSRFLTGSNDRTAWLWDAVTGQPLTPPLQHPDKVLVGGFGPDGKLVVTVCEDRFVRLWDAITGRRVGPAFSHPDEVTAFAFRRDGSQLATAGADGVVRLWDLPSPARGEANWLRRAAEGLTGMTLTDRGALQELDAPALARRRQDLRRRGDPLTPARLGPGRAN